MLLLRSAGWCAKTYENCSFSGIFSRVASFLQVFGQVKGQIMIEQHKIIRHVVACPIAFILLYERRWQGKIFKVIKNDHFF